MNKKVSVARLSVISNTFLILLKFIAGIMSGSVSIISEAIHSMMDLLAAIIAFFSVRVSDNPPDEKHPYGHGKYENISGVIEAVLIFIAAGWIIYEAIKKMLDPSGIEQIGIGFVVMSVSAIVNILVSRRLYKVAKETGSVALEADALHLKTDVYTSIGVAMGLVLIYLTGLYWLDPIVAIGVALLIIKESYSLLKRAYSPLLDVSLSESEQNVIKEIISESGYEYHDLRTRKSGNQQFADFHLIMPGYITLEEAHNQCDILENKLQNRIPGIMINIHTETIENN
jgi:cation diffusion facilitator family transporter